MVERTLWIAGSLVSFAIVAAACSDSSTENQGGQGTGGSPPANTFQSSECGTCVETSCDPEIQACLTDPGCTTYLDCLLHCPVDEKGNADPACDAACVGTASSSETLKAEADLKACRFYGSGATCEACSIPTAPVSTQLNQQCEPRPDPPPTQCRACYWEKCCDTWDACYADGVNPDCDALATCIQACGDPIEPCVDACFDAHPNSVTTLLDQVGCSVSLCAADQPDCDVEARDDCDTCLAVDCGDSFVSLLSTAEGYLLWLCLADCGDSGGGVQCTEGCFDAHPEAQDAGFLWADCLTYQCSTRC